MSELVDSRTPDQDAREVRVTISHRVALARAGLRRILEVDPGFDLREEDDTRDAERVDDVRSQVTVTDPASAIQSLLRSFGTTSRDRAPRLLVVADGNDTARVSRAWRLGTRGFTTLSASPRELIEAVWALASGPEGEEAGDCATTLRVEAPRGGIAPHALRRVREHVERHLGQKLDIAKLSEVAGLSCCHFARAFKQSMGVSPHRYVMMRRIASATELIRTTRMPLTDISRTVGFLDPSHFTRAFASHVGSSPSAFRRLAA